MHRLCHHCAMFLHSCSTTEGEEEEEEEEGEEEEEEEEELGVHDGQADEPCGEELVYGIVQVDRVDRSGGPPMTQWHPG